jgi:F0F1-type ATP synthase assembly protein I
LWPWFLLILILLGLLLAILWLSVEVRRLQERRKYYIPTGETNTTNAGTNAPASPPR